MEFYTNQLFHIYNQGNNRRQLYFSEDNYKFFVWKMRAYLPLFGDIIAWCLMPNHFHWLFYVKHIEVERTLLWERVDKIEWLRRKIKYGKKANEVSRSHTRVSRRKECITLNEAIGILENAYSQAVNRERGWSGSIFRDRCKAKDGWIDEFVTVSNNKKVPDYKFLPGSGFAYHCLNYIHDNPTEADLVRDNLEWHYSSARDYAGLRKGTLCNLEFGRELIKYL